MYEVLPSDRIAPSARVRICLPGSRASLTRGEFGELHKGRMTIISEYLGGECSDFYTDEVGLWHVTDDQAIMAETGENLDPMEIPGPTIEYVFNKIEIRPEELVLA